MEYLLIRLNVKDYPQWRALYDAEATARTEAGLTEQGLYRGSDDPNDVVIFFTIVDKMQARSYLYEPELIARRRDCLRVEPEIVFLL